MEKNLINEIHEMLSDLTKEEYEAFINEAKVHTNNKFLQSVIEAIEEQ